MGFATAMITRHGVNASENVRCLLEVFRGANGLCAPKREDDIFLTIPWFYRQLRH